MWKNEKGEKSGRMRENGRNGDGRERGLGASLLGEEEEEEKSFGEGDKEKEM